jgi:hypothetical protein
MSSAALRKPIIAAIDAAGGRVWDKLFVALRASRDTELRELAPSHVVDDWIGHTEAVARKNYLQVTDAHFEQFTQDAKQNAKQYVAASARTDLQTKQATPDERRELPLNAALCEAVPEHQVGVTGLEPVTSAM